MWQTAILAHGPQDAALHDFQAMQVFSAICVIFAHGAGEVGYMAGPLATIWDVYTKGKLNKSVQPQIWIILIGALGLVIVYQQHKQQFSMFIFETILFRFDSLLAPCWPQGL